MADSVNDPAPGSSTARLRRGAVILLVLFWAVHLVIMLVRAELNDPLGHRSFADSFVRRGGFALFGAVLGYALYRALLLIERHGFLRQIALGAGLALLTACVQGAANAVVFDNGSPFMANFLYSSMYWFWFYFCWTTAYLAFAYSIAVQDQQRRAAALAVEAREAQVRALRYQVNPHFLFNTLNAIAALVRDAPAKAEEMVVQLSEFFRRSLAVNPLEDLTLAEEVELQRLYLAIEHTRFPDRLSVEVDLDEGSGSALVPALLLQPLIENAVKHGVGRSEAPTRIRILASVEDGMLMIEVVDDARSLGTPSKGESVGLRNVRERLASRHGSAASLTAEPIDGGGFRNVIRMPLER